MDGLYNRGNKARPPDLSTNNCLYSQHYGIIGRLDALIDIGLYSLTVAIYRTAAVIDIVAIGTVPSVDISAIGCYRTDKRGSLGLIIVGARAIECCRIDKRDSLGLIIVGA